MACSDEMVWRDEMVSGKMSSNLNQCILSRRIREFHLASVLIVDISLSGMATLSNEMSH
jgi:hypothetical protein